jgi:thioredoxin reductase (NADPH)
MFPVLDQAEVDRLRRFGSPRSFAAGEALVRVGEPGHGLFLIVSGQVQITRGNPEQTAIVTHGPGSFVGELAQLTGRPILVDGYAVTPVEAVVIPPEWLRALLVAEADLGERIMRALILRRVGLLETPGVGAIIVGRSGDADVLRLQGFLDRNGEPHQTMDPETDPEARALIRARPSSPAASAWSGRSTRTGCSTSPSWARGRLDLPPPSTPPPRAWRC